MHEDRRERRPETPVPASGTRMKLGNEIYPAWHDIIRHVQKSMSERVSMDGDHTVSSEYLFHHLDGLIHQHREWGVEQSGLPDLTKAVLMHFTGLGPLQPLLTNPVYGLEEIMCNRYDELFLRYAGDKYEQIASPFPNNEAVKHYIDQLLWRSGVSLHRQNPYIDTRIAGGHRLHAEDASLAPRGYCFSIRVHNLHNYTLADYVKTGFLTEELLADLTRWVQERKNIVICGQTGSGKTTFLNTLLRDLVADERVISLEVETNELQLKPNIVNWVPLISRRPDDHAKRHSDQSVELDQLLRNVLRMSPDRIVVGEVRGKEAAVMLSAMATGHTGGFTTFHADDAVDSIDRLLEMAMEGTKINEQWMERKIGRAIDIIIHLAGREAGRRGINDIIAISRVRPHEQPEPGSYKYGELFVKPLWSYENDGLVRH